MGVADAEAMFENRHLPGQHPQAKHGHGKAKFDLLASEAMTGQAALDATAFDSAGMRFGAQVDRAIADYGGEGPDSYLGINSGLRDGSQMTAQQMANVGGLDAAMKEASATGKPMVVYRSVGSPELVFGGKAGDYGGGILRMKIVAPSGVKAISHRDLDSDEVLFDRGHSFTVVADYGKSKADITGLSWRDKGFVSTSAIAPETFYGDRLIDVLLGDLDD